MIIMPIRRTQRSAMRSNRLASPLYLPVAAPATRRLHRSRTRTHQLNRYSQRCQQWLGWRRTLPDQRQRRAPRARTQDRPILVPRRGAGAARRRLWLAHLPSMPVGEVVTPPRQVTRSGHRARRGGLLRVVPGLASLRPGSVARSQLIGEGLAAWHGQDGARPGSVADERRLTWWLRGAGVRCTGVVSVGCASAARGAAGQGRTSGRCGVSVVPLKIDILRAGLPRMRSGVAGAKGVKRSRPPRSQPGEDRPVRRGGQSTLRGRLLCGRRPRSDRVVGGGKPMLHGPG